MSAPLRPLVVVTLPLLAGLLLSLRFSPDPLPFLLLTLLSLPLALHTERSSPPPSPFDLSGPALLLAFAAAGATLGSVAARDARADCRAWIADGARVQVTGLLGAAAGLGPEAGGAPLLPLERAELRVGARACRATVRVRLDPDSALAAGSEVRAAGEWIRTQPVASATLWPAEPLYQGFLAVDTIVGVRRPDALRHPLLAARGAAEARLARLFPRHFGLAEALLLGRRERLDDEVRDRFVRAGLVHLLAISGAHVALFGAMLVLLGGAARIRRDRVRLGTIGLTGLYLALIGAPGSAVRAGIMLSVVLLGGLLQRPAAALPVVACAAIAIVAWDPNSILDPGVQLSFAGVGALMVASRVPLHALPRPLRRGLPRALVDASVVSVLAFAATAPIAAHHFGAVSPVAIPANLPAVPLTSLALVGVVSALAVDLVAPPLAHLLADGAALALQAVDLIARLAARVPFGYVGVTRPEWGGWLLAAVAGAAAARVLARAARPVRVLGASGVALSVALALPALPALPPLSGGGVRGGLEIHLIDVGQGDAVAIRTPADRWILIDAGPRSETYDAGARRVLPFLRARGASRVALLILTHPHADHIGGAAAVLDGIEVGHLAEPGLPAGTEMYAGLLDRVEGRGVPWSRAVAGRRISLDGVELDFLWPEAGMIEGTTDANEASAVVRLRYGGFAAVFPGDAYADAERAIVRREGRAMRAQLLKAGHHGSATSTSEALLAAVRPELVVISAGRRNRHGHPSPEVMARLRDRGVAVARTDLEGTVSLRAGADGRWARFTP